MSSRVHAFSAPGKLMEEVDRVVAEYNSIMGVSTTRSGYIRSVLEQRIRQEPEFLRRMRAAAMPQVALEASHISDAA